MNDPLTLDDLLWSLKDSKVKKLSPNSTVVAERFNDMDWLKLRTPDGEVVYIPLSEPWPRPEKDSNASEDVSEMWC